MSIILIYILTRYRFTIQSEHFIQSVSVSDITGKRFASSHEACEGMTTVHAHTNTVHALIRKTKKKRTFAR